jgi:hypothetical protein
VMLRMTSATGVRIRFRLSSRDWTLCVF